MLITVLLIAANLLFSTRGLMTASFFESYVLQIDKVRDGKDYKRLLSAGFLHVNWLHLLLNVYAIYAFGYQLELLTGPWQFLAIYFTGLLGGNLLALLLHRKQGSYRVAGASGAVCAVIFSTIAASPMRGISLFGLLTLPGWIFGLLFLAYTVYGIRSEHGPMSPTPQLGGALAGLVLSLLFYPQTLYASAPIVLAIVALTLLFMLLGWRQPRLSLFSPRRNAAEPDGLTIDDRYNLNRAQQQQEIDRILDKISQKGASSLSEKEKKLLREYSEKQ